MPSGSFGRPVVLPVGFTAASIAKSSVTGLCPASETRVPSTNCQSSPSGSRRVKPVGLPGSSKPTPVMRGQPALSTRSGELLATLKQMILWPVSTEPHLMAIGASAVAVGLETNAVASVGELRPRTIWAYSLGANVTIRVQNRTMVARFTDLAERLILTGTSLDGC